MAAVIVIVSLHYLLKLRGITNLALKNITALSLNFPFPLVLDCQLMMDFFLLHWNSMYMCVANVYVHVYKHVHTIMETRNQYEWSFSNLLKLYFFKKESFTESGVHWLAI